MSQLYGSHAIAARLARTPTGTPSRRRWRETPRARGTKRRTQAYNLVKAGLLEKPLEFGFVMGAPNAQECDLGVLRCCGAFTLLM